MRVSHSLRILGPLVTVGLSLLGTPAGATVIYSMDDGTGESAAGCVAARIMTSVKSSTWIRWYNPRLRPNRGNTGREAHLKILSSRRSPGPREKKSNGRWFETSRRWLKR